MRQLCCMYFTNFSKHRFNDSYSGKIFHPYFQSGMCPLGRDLWQSVQQEKESGKD